MSVVLYFDNDCNCIFFKRIHLPEMLKHRQNRVNFKIESEPDKFKEEQET